MIQIDTPLITGTLGYLTGNTSVLEWDFQLSFTFSNSYLGRVGC